MPAPRPAPIPGPVLRIVWAEYPPGPEVVLLETCIDELVMFVDGFVNLRMLNIT